MEYKSVADMIDYVRYGLANHFVKYINDKKVLEVKFQDGTTDNGKNGIFVEDLLAIATAKIVEYNNIVPCEENEEAVRALIHAIFSLERRKEDRKSRGVYATYKK